MKVHVRSRHIELNDMVRIYVERRLEFALGRLSGRVVRATVHVVDINGPRGGEDKVCRIEVRLRPTGTVLVGDADADLFVAIDGAVERAAEAVARALKRTREVRRRAAPGSGSDGESFGLKPRTSPALASLNEEE
jgi:putative sigma-54 modulation protein